MQIIPHTLSLITTHTCTASCDHCCFSCTPSVTKRIPYERMEILIKEAATIPSMEVVVFTGGECFLLGSELDKLIELATFNSLSTRCVTNGYWATSLDVARKRIKSLYKAGLKEINFSTGSNHAKFVPVNAIRNGVLASAEAGIFTLVTAEIFSESDFSLDFLTSDELVNQLISSGKIQIHRNVWIENEGVRKITHLPEYSRFDPKNKTPCQTVLNVLAVTPTENLVACCGLHLEKIKEMHLGSVAEHSITQLISSAETDLIKIWIHLEGPEKVLEFVQKKNPSYKLPIHSVHPCQTCLYLYQDEVVRNTLQQHAQEYESELMQKYQISITTRLLNMKLREISSSPLV